MTRSMWSVADTICLSVRFCSGNDISDHPSLLIAGDMGGTKTLLAIYDPAVGARTPLVEREYRSANYPALEVIVKEFLAATNLSVQAACFDVAGPVIDGGARLTNLPWMV